MQDVQQDAGDFHEVETSIAESDSVDPDVARDIALVTAAALGEAASDQTARGLVEETRELARVASEELVSGRVVREQVAEMETVHDSEMAKWKWRLGGFSVVFLKRNQAPLRRLAERYPMLLAWLPGVLDWAFGSQDPEN